jgi:tRNA dimethylallyltransferase
MRQNPAAFRSEFCVSYTRATRVIKNLAIAVAGPTCSGKSALALELADKLGGTVINADAMQVYRDLRIVTARPSPEEEARVPHALYGVRPAAQTSTVAWWRGAAITAMHTAQAEGRLPILCGGTGLYLASLTQGLAAIPEPGEAARHEARAMLDELGPPGLHARLAQVDPHTAAHLRPSDSQRLARAWEVWRGTGRGIADWQSAQLAPADFPWTIRAIILDPPRDALRGAIARRFTAMLEHGAITEVESLLAQNLPSALPAMRAHGVPELSAYLRGDITLEEAGRRTCLVTGQYTKRQATWFRHRHIAAPDATHRFLARFESSTQFLESKLTEIINIIYQAG